jgi:hypothetical protein
MARQALRRAQAEMSSSDPERLEYAALELRKAMEAVIYDRAQLYPSRGIMTVWSAPVSKRKWIGSSMTPNLGMVISAVMKGLPFRV